MAAFGFPLRPLSTFLYWQRANLKAHCPSFFLGQPLGCTSSGSQLNTFFSQFCSLTPQNASKPKQVPPTSCWAPKFQLTTGFITELYNSEFSTTTNLSDLDDSSKSDVGFDPRQYLLPHLLSYIHVLINYRETAHCFKIWVSNYPVPLAIDFFFLLLQNTFSFFLNSLRFFSPASRRPPWYFLAIFPQ